MSLSEQFRELTGESSDDRGVDGIKMRGKRRSYHHKLQQTRQSDRIACVVSLECRILSRTRGAIPYPDDQEPHVTWTTSKTGTAMYPE